MNLIREILRPLDKEDRIVVLACAAAVLILTAIALFEAVIAHQG